MVLKKILIIILSVLFLNIVVAQQQNVYNDCEIYGNCLPDNVSIININQTINVTSVNATDFWNTNIGSLQNVNTTQFEGTGGDLTIKNSWLTSFINAFNFLTGNIFNQSLNTTDNVTFHNISVHNITASGNINASSFTLNGTTIFNWSETEGSNNSNTTEWWITSIGNLDNANETQFENNGGNLSINESWLDFFINAFNFITGNIFDQSLNTTDDVTFNNITASAFFVGDGTFITNLNELDPKAYNGTLAFLSQILGWNYYNSSNFSIVDYYNKSEVDDIVSSLAFDFFFTNHTSDISGHLNLSETDEGHPESSVTSPSLSAGDTPIFNFTTQFGQPEFNELRKGVYDVRLHLFKTGTKSVFITPKLYNISSDGLSKNLLITFETSIELTTIDATYDLHGTLNEEIILDSGDRLHMEFVATVGPSGSNPTVTLDMEGTTDTHLTIETSSNAFENIFLRQDGTKPLSANWNVGDLNITNMSYLFVDDISLKFGDLISELNPDGVNATRLKGTASDVDVVIGDGTGYFMVWNAVDDTAVFFVNNVGDTDILGDLTIGDDIFMSEDGIIGISASTERIVFDGTGGDINLLGANVGIGTSSPDSVFHIKANTPGTVGSHPAGQLIIQDPDDTVFGNAVITGYESDGSGNPDQQLWYLGSSSSSNSNIIFLNRRNALLQFGTNDNTQMTILGNGNVGIGTTIPTQELEVNGSLNVTELIYGNGSQLFDVNFTEKDSSAYNGSLILTINESNLNVNSSDFWDDVDTFNTTQFEDDGGELHLKDTWFEILFDFLFGTKDTDDLTEGSTNLYDNQSWNETNYIDNATKTFLKMSNKSLNGLYNFDNISVANETLTYTLNVTLDAVIGGQADVGQLKAATYEIQFGGATQFEMIIFDGADWIKQVPPAGGENSVLTYCDFGPSIAWIGSTPCPI